MPSARLLTQRLRGLAPEALAFGVIGAANTLLYLAIVWVALPIGAVKASILATVVTTTVAYAANRYWTYRHRPRSALRREYTLFFGFNLAGMVIQSGAVAVGKYGFGLTEADDRELLFAITLVGIGVATIFRFWAYRTFVFLKPKPVDEEVLGIDAVAGLAELSAETTVPPQLRSGSEDIDELELEAELEYELDAAERHTTH